ncbi:phosphatidate cytidylyltransferase [Sphingomonas aracearum]|uniref:Phosphatidate cytidylyltransferase n=1 Tax=Sphingomonas aracearum TaxID=2283317 RepID=A0A369VST2_9SPHN|nr:phosphatidate cytidylyltransferase [Sphingomonas aracearum]RDE05073.1 phosphatidate cytidylyltransferase [Sphingomonas aracearum]
MSGRDVPKSRELAIRTAAGVTMIAAAALALWAGDLVFWLFCSVLGLVMMYEWGGLDRATPRAIRLAQLAVGVPLAILSPLAAGPGFFALGLIAGAAFFIVIVTRRPQLAFGAVYVGLPILALLLIREEPRGIEFTFWTLAVVWAADTGAYFSGRTFGGPKLMPRVSPNKTWAGLGGGIVAAGLFGVAMHYGTGLPLRMVLASPALAVLAQAGDLYESWLKRRVGAKDSGTLIPGHGGVLDRLDGLVPVAPVAALLVVAPRFLYPLLGA